VIVTVCADKGSPGVSWTATVLGMVWPGERVLLEADPSGGDAVLRLRTPEGQLLARQPALRGLAVDARSGNLPTSLLSYAHQTSCSDSSWSLRASAGVFQSRTLRGRPFRAVAATASKSTKRQVYKCR
jgi:hypothetical protein